MRTIAIAAAACTAALLLTGCSAASPGHKCLTVDPALAKSIVAASKNGETLTAESSAAVVSKDFKGPIYIIAIKFKAGSTEATGEWASTTLSNKAGGTILSADHVASAFTVFPDHMGSMQLTASTDGVDASAACLK